MSRFSNKLNAFVLSGFFIVALASCGGGETENDPNLADGTTSKSKGTVGILLTDKPADSSEFTEINASIEKIELIGDKKSDKSVVLFSGETKTIDLLTLKNEAIPFTFRDDVPIGSYCKIRLILSDLELVLSDDTPDDNSDNETFHPDLPGNGKLDLISRDCFTVEEGKVVTVQLDMDAGNSIHITDNKKGYQFRPVVYVDVLSQHFKSKMVRLEGDITAVNSEDSTLTICGALPQYNSKSSSCVKVLVGENAAFFDNVNHSGAPRSMEELLSDDNVDATVSIVGFPEHLIKTSVSKSVKVPPGHYPPKGQCRLWAIGVPPGQQSPPGDCDELKQNVSDTSVLIDYKGKVKTKSIYMMELDALVVELGEFLQVEGQVASNVEQNEFTIDVNPGGSIIFDDALSVGLHEDDADINGTRVVSKSGQLIDISEIAQPRIVSVDGVLDLSNDATMLNAALIIVDMEVSASQQVTGIVLSVEEDGMTIEPELDVVCGVATDSLEVMFADDLKLLSIVITEDGSEISTGGEIAVDKNVGINGYCKTEGYFTNNVVIVDDQRI